MRISDWSSDVCSSDLHVLAATHHGGGESEPRAAQLCDGVVVATQAHERNGLRAAFGHARGGPGQGQRRMLRKQHRRDAEVRGRTQDRAEVVRSEEHTSELQSLMRTSYAGFCLK